MPIRPGAPQAPAPAQADPRRATPAEPRAWVRSVFGLSRKPAPAAPERPARAVMLPPEVIEMRDELSALFLDLDDGHDALTLRHLVLVHDELGARGWPGVEALPAPVLRKARIQAEMLASRARSLLLAAFIERLQLAEIAAAVRDGEESPVVEPSRPAEEELAEMSRFVEVSDTSFEEYEITERSWVGTVPSGLGKPGREHWPAPPASDTRVEAGPGAGKPAPLEIGTLDAPLALEKIVPPVPAAKLDVPVLVERLELSDLVEKVELSDLVEKVETRGTIEFEVPVFIETFPPLPRSARPEPSEHWVDFDRD